MLRTNYRCVQSLNISVDVAKCVENVHTLIHNTLTFGLLQKMTCLHWTINSWQSFNSLGCPVMLKTNYRCVQLLNISVDVAKCVENVHKFTQFTHFLCVTKNDLSWLNNLFMERFLLNKMSTYVKNKLQMCSVTQHLCRCLQIFGKCSQIQRVHSLIPVTKNDLSWLNNLFMARFQLIRMSSYAKYKLQMCSVTQHQCRHRQMCGKCSHSNSLHSLCYDCYKKDDLLRTCSHEQSQIHKVFMSVRWLVQLMLTIGCPLMLEEQTTQIVLQSLRMSS